MRIFLLVFLSLLNTAWGQTVPEHDCHSLHPVIDTLTNHIDEILHKPNDLYSELKQNFESSDFCKPQHVVTTPDRPDPAVMSQFLRRIRTFNTEKDESFCENFSFSQSECQELIQIKTNNGNLEVEGIKLLVNRFRRRGDFYNPYMNQLIRENLITHNIFSPDGNCPFLSKDVFEKALQGQRNIRDNRITNPDQITVVDYTRPSNERRMFVIDLKNKKVLLNTWVAHGGGSGAVTGPDGLSEREMARGTDGVGGSPDFSNRSGQNLSSDGFIIATRASSAPKYGPNVILEGIDSNNSNLRSRSVIVHRWSTPYSSYQDRAPEPFGASSNDPLEKILNGTDDATAVHELRQVLRNPPAYLGATQGCLGLPENEMERAREILPGSLIFSYSGPEMQSWHLR
jgi:hypothetical protein